ncbi:hypothetical protein P2318_03885 [Myxococcaceae bacterium GXIMD 01537]
MEYLTFVIVALFLGFLLFTIFLGAMAHKDTERLLHPPRRPEQRERHA